MTDAGRQEDADVSLTEKFVEATAVYENIHHLGHTEGVPEVVEWIVPIVLLDSQQESDQKVIVLPGLCFVYQTFSKWRDESQAHRPARARETFPPGETTSH